MEITPKAKKLTLRQSKFVNEYLIDLNVTQAAIRAGYSKKTAASIGSEYLKKPHVALAVAKAFGERQKRTLVTQDDVVTGLLHEARNNTKDASHGARVSAWAHLGKHLGMFTDKVEISGALAITSISNLMDDLANDETYR